MKKQLIYDLPTRVLHWLFAGLFLSAFCISNIFDDESPIFSYHMLIGLILVFVLALRLIWGLFGTQYARFSGFNLNPIELIRYFQGILTGSKKRWVGHNPATSWAAIIMMSFASGLGITGYLMTSSTNSDSIKDIHELLANGFIIIVLFHIAGIVIHSIRHQEMVAISMIDGKKDGVSPEVAIKSSRSLIGVLVMVLVGTFSFLVFKNYDSKTQTLQIFGSTLQLGENEGSENSENENDGNGSTEDKDGDDD